jgi:hypothetical protein
VARKNGAGFGVLCDNWECKGTTRNSYSLKLNSILFT